MSDLPSGWANASLADLGVWCGGGTPSKSKSEFWIGGTIPWVSPKDMKVPLIADAEDHITEAAVSASATNVVPVGSVLAVTRSGILRRTFPVAVTTSAVAINQDLKALKPIDGINPKYVAYYLRRDEQSILHDCSKDGTTVDSIDFPALLKREIPIAPYAEQERIVAAIEEQFSRHDAGVGGLQLVQQNLKRMRAAVLQAAATGLLDSADRLTPRRPLGEALSFLDQGWSPRCENTPAEDEDHWGVIKTTAVQAMHFDESANKRLPNTLSPRPDYELRPGDLLITRAGPRARAGVCCLVRKVRPRLMICDKVYRFRANVNVALPEYLELILNSPSITKRIDQLKTGISDSGVNITQQKFRELKIALPALDVQEMIVATTETYLSIIEAIETNLKMAVIRAHQLRSAVLTSAFSGKLVPQDSADEPASVLLTRIAAEQGVSNGGRTSRIRDTRTQETVRT